MRALRHSLITCSAALLVLFAASPRLVAAQGRSAEAKSDAAAIRAARLAQNAAIVANNLDQIASYWTDDVTITRGLGAIVQGRAAYRQLFVGDTITYERTPARVVVSTAWPLAFETGTWTGRPANGGKPVIRGSYSAQWLKRDGRWLIHSEVFVALGCAGAGCAWPTTFPK